MHHILSGSKGQIEESFIHCDIFSSHESFYANKFPADNQTILF